MQDRLNVKQEALLNYYFDPTLLDKWSDRIPVLEKLVGDNDFIKYQEMLENRIQDLIQALAYATFTDSDKDYLEVVAKRAAIDAYKEILTMPRTVLDQLKAMSEHIEGGQNA